MKRLFLCERGFTLIEMLVVLMIISVLLLIAIPNLTKNNNVAAEKGCDATIKLLQTQVHAYEVEHAKEATKLTSLEQLVDGEYVERIECPNGKKPILENGVVKPPKD